MIDVPPVGDLNGELDMAPTFKHPKVVRVERRDVRDPVTGEMQDALVIGTTLQTNENMAGYEYVESQALLQEAIDHWKEIGVEYETVGFADLHVPEGVLDYGANELQMPVRASLEFYDGKLAVMISDIAAAEAVSKLVDRTLVTMRPRRGADFVRSEWIGHGHHLVGARKKDGVARKAIKFTTDDRREIEVTSRSYDHDAMLNWVSKYLGYKGQSLPTD